MAVVDRSDKKDPWRAQHLGVSAPRATNAPPFFQPLVICGLAGSLAKMERNLLQNDTMLTDDAVAELLAKEANNASIKYSSMGLEAFRSAKYAPPKPKHTASDGAKYQ